MARLDNQIRLVVGLGNPGADYTQTRHNAGFLVLDELKSRFKATDWTRKAKGEYCKLRIKNKMVTLLKPMTYMNLSGNSVREFLRVSETEPDEMLVVHDDLDIEAGLIRVKVSGGHGGHNGIRSIMDCIGTGEFSRIRVGLGRPVTGKNTVDFVLGSPQNDDKQLFDESLEKAADAVELIVRENSKSAMDRFNKRNKGGISCNV